VARASYVSFLFPKRLWRHYYFASASQAPLDGSLHSAPGFSVRVFPLQVTRFHSKIAERHNGELPRFHGGAGGLGCENKARTTSSPPYFEASPPWNAFFLLSFISQSSFPRLLCFYREVILSESARHSLPPQVLLRRFPWVALWTVTPVVTPLPAVVLLLAHPSFGSSSLRRSNPPWDADSIPFPLAPNSLLSSFF